MNACDQIEVKAFREIYAELDSKAPPSVKQHFEL
jgi:hypothetical protein